MSRKTDSKFYLCFVANRGYLAPEYALGGHLTMKADVYSFGVLTLEVVSGRTCANDNYGGTQELLVEWVGDFFQLLCYLYLYILLVKWGGLIVTAETIYPLYAFWLKTAETQLIELHLSQF